MTASNNDGGFSRLGTDPTAGGLRDGTDHPHSGLFHALNVASKGSYAILDGNNFDITQSDSSGNTQFAVADGQVFRDGKLSATVTGVNFTQGTPAAFDEPTSSGSAYYLLVVTSGNVLSIKDNGNRDTTDTVPNLSSGDIPIAVIRLAYGESTTSRFIQFLTTNKTENSLSIGQGTSTVYSEQMSIISDGTDVTFTGASNTDIKFTPAGTGKIDVTTGDMIVSNGNFETPNGYSETTIVESISDGGGAGLTAGAPVYPTGFGSGKITVDLADATNSSNKHPAIGLVYSTISASGNGKVIISGLSGDISATLFDAGSYSEGDIIYLSPNVGKLTNTRPTATTDIIQNIGRIVHLSSFTAGSSGTAKVLVQGSGRENDTPNAISTQEITVDSDFKLSVSSNDAIIENTNSDNDIIFKVNDGGSSGTEVMRIDGSESRVGIGTTTPTKKMEVKGDVHLSRRDNSGETRTLSLEGARNATGNDYARIDFQNYDSDGPTSYTGGRISVKNEADGVNDGSMLFYTSNNAGTLTERMRIIDSGEIGIATTTPATTLHVNGGFTSTGIRSAVAEAIGNSGPATHTFDGDDYFLHTKSVASTPPAPPNNVNITIPAASSTIIGQRYRILCSANAGGVDDVTIAFDSGDSVYNATHVAGSTTQSLTGGKLYDIICVSASEWFLLVLN